MAILSAFQGVKGRRYYVQKVFFLVSTQCVVVVLESAACMLEITNVYVRDCVPSTEADAEWLARRVSSTCNIVFVYPNTLYGLV